MINFRRTRLRIIVIVCAVAWSLTSCDNEGTVQPPVDPLYPTRISPLSSADLAALESAYQNQNPRFCGGLDKYGWPTGSCIMDSQGVDPDTPKEEMIALARQEVVRNVEFTGVSDVSALQDVRRAAFLSGTPFVESKFLVDFRNQRYKDLEVLFTPLTVWEDSLGALAMRGHHYTDIYFPATRVRPGTAQFILVGEEIPWYDVLGIEHIFTITWDSFLADPIKVIVPRIVGETIELRVAWQVLVGDEGLSWYVYIDLQTEEHLLTLPRFSA